MANNPLVDLGSLARPAEILVQRFCDGVGGSFKPWQLRRIAKAESDAEIIRARGEIEKQRILDAASLGKTEIGQRAIARLIEREVKNQINTEEILSKAIESLQPNSRPEQISSDFVISVFEKSKSVSESDLQELWGRLIASEANQPSSVPKIVLETLARMDSQDASLFDKFSVCCLGIPGISDEPSIFPFFTTGVEELLKMHGIDFEALRHFETLGLISIESLGYNYSGSFRDPSRENAVLLGRNAEWATIVFEPTERFRIDVGKILLTKAGKKIVTLGREPNNHEVFAAALTDQIRDGRWVSTLWKPAA